ncbi:MAG TPA: CBS domain-containing protein [Ilumatobacteraceae bacterium]|nr:CBS domain-containing protein [Ilumatobacteraceae bacterium]
MSDMGDPGALRIDVLIGDTVVCVVPTATLREVANVLIDDGISAVVVGSQERPVGIVSEHDIVRAVADGADSSTTAADIAHTQLFWSEASSSVAEVATQMMDQYVRHILVEDEGRLAGIVSARDLLGVYAISEGLPGNDGSSDSDKSPNGDTSGESSSELSGD